MNGHCLPQIGSSCSEDVPHGSASGPTIMSLLIVQTGKLIAVEIRKLVFSACECSPQGCHDSFTNLFILLLPIEGYELCFFTEIYKETLFLTLMKVYGSHTVGLRNCEYVLSTYENKN